MQAGSDLIIGHVSEVGVGHHQAAFLTLHVIDGVDQGVHLGAAVGWIGRTVIGGGAHECAPGNADPIKDGDQRTFMKDVVEASRQIPVLVDFWATWCGPCMDEIDSVADRLSTLKENQSVVLFVSLDFDLESHAKRIEKLPKNVLYTCDGQSAHGQLASLFAVIHLPANVVISPDGKLLSTSLSDIFPMDQKDKTR